MKSAHRSILRLRPVKRSNMMVGCLSHHTCSRSRRNGTWEKSTRSQTCFTKHMILDLAVQNIECWNINFNCTSVLHDVQWNAMGVVYRIPSSSRSNFQWGVRRSAGRRASCTGFHRIITSYQQNSQGRTRMPPWPCRLAENKFGEVTISSTPFYDMVASSPIKTAECSWFMAQTRLHVLPRTS